MLQSEVIHLSLTHLIPLVMDTKAVFTALYDVCEENAAFFSGGIKAQAGDTSQRLVDSMTTIQEHARTLEPVITGFAAIYHHFDFDPHVPANGYRSLVKVNLRLSLMSLMSWLKGERSLLHCFFIAENICSKCNILSS